MMRLMPHFTCWVDNEMKNDDYKTILKALGNWIERSLKICFLKKKTIPNHLKKSILFYHHFDAKRGKNISYDVKKNDSIRISDICTHKH